MNKKFKSRILNNTFVDQVRISMVFDEDAFYNLCNDLKLLAKELKGSKVIDRELMLSLYSIPLVVRNMFLSFSNTEPLPEIAIKLEDAWVDLDALVVDCLSD